jgi:hypothetical protein
MAGDFVDTLINWKYRLEFLWKQTLMWPALVYFLNSGNSNTALTKGRICSLITLGLLFFVSRACDLNRVYFEPHNAFYSYWRR